MVESKLTWQKFWTPLSTLVIFFDPPSVKNENILTRLQRNIQFWIISKETFHPPLKKNVQFFHPPSSKSSKAFDPPHMSTTPYCWVKNDQPLIMIERCINWCKKINFAEEDFWGKITITERLIIKMKYIVESIYLNWKSHVCLLTTRFFCKNVLYKNVQAEICRKFKNVLRTFRGSNSNQHRNLSMKLHKILWCLLLMLDFYVKAILNIALYTSLYHYRGIIIHIPLFIWCLCLQTGIGSPSALFARIYIPQKTELSNKNVLRILEAHF